jgi:hypothetical protein
MLGASRTSHEHEGYIPGEPYAVKAASVVLATIFRIGNRPLPNILGSIGGYASVMALLS